MIPVADLQYWANILQIVGGVGVVAALAALVLAWVQLRKTQNATRGQMLLALDQALAPFDDIRDDARDRNWRPPLNRDRDSDAIAYRRRVKKYMAVWERVEHLVTLETIELRDIDRLYGPRIENLLRNPVVRDYLIEMPSQWDSFIALASRLVTFRPHMKKWVDEVKQAVEAKGTASSAGRAA